MARLNKMLHGSLTGALGDVVFRRVNGKVFVCQRSKSFMPGKDRASVERRARFAFSVKLAREIYSIPELKAVWETFRTAKKTARSMVARPHGNSTYNLIHRTNLSLINSNPVTKLLTITPPHGFNVKTKGASISPTGIAIEFAAIGKAAGIALRRELSVKLVYVLSLGNPTNKTYPKMWFISGTSGSQKLTLNRPLAFSIHVSGDRAPIFKAYKDRTLLCAMVTLDNRKRTMRYSTTIIV